MKRYILTLLLAACVCTACDKDDEYEIREWTVASQLGIAHGASTLQPVLLVKANDDTSWRAVYQGIEGFDFEAGYEYRLRIKAEQLPDPPQDGSSIRYTCWSKFRRPRRPRSSPTSSSRSSRWRSPRSR